MLPSGQRISHYLLRRRLKTGGMGAIYLAEDEHLARQVAIKIITIDYDHVSESEEAEEAARLFLREARAIARFNHDHILPIYEVGQDTAHDGEVMYMVMPYCPEGSLADWLYTHDISLPLPAQDVAHILTQAAEALQLAHDHFIIHQDVKPGNFLVRQAAAHPAQLKIQLADFGIAKLLRASSETLSVRGTPFYMAPEQWEGRAEPATDQYSLAVMAYEFLAGRRPFRGNNAQHIWYQHVHVRPEPPSAFNPHLNSALDAIILRALAKSPTERFSSVTAFAEAFQRTCYKRNHGFPSSEENGAIALANRATLPPTVHAPPPTRNQSPPPEQRRQSAGHRVIIPFLLVLLLIAVSTGLFFFIRAQGYKSGNATPTSPATKNQTASSLTALAQRQMSTVQAQQTSSAQINATNVAATVNANATATINAIATDVVATHAAGTATAVAFATATVTTYYNKLGVSGLPGFDDPLHDNSQGNRWDVVNLQDGSCGFTQDIYYASTTANTFAPCFAETPRFSTMVYQITQTISKGDQGGITFCGDSQAGNYYAFTISASGSYSLVVYQDYQVIDTLAQGTSTAIHTGAGQYNLLAVRVVNGVITMFINMQSLPPVNNSTYTTGAIGVIAVSSNNATLVEFTNAEVWKLS
jgi:eukaryotic-like serine/threonine-protein kinase